MPYCTNCGTKSSRENCLRNGCCRECRALSDEVAVDMDDSTPMSSVKFGEMKHWFARHLDEAVVSQLTDLKTEFSTLTKEFQKVKQGLKDCVDDVAILKEDVNNLKEKNKDERSVSDTT